MHFSHEWRSSMCASMCVCFEGRARGFVRVCVCAAFACVCPRRRETRAFERVLTRRSDKGQMFYGLELIGEGLGGGE